MTISTKTLQQIHENLIDCACEQTEDITLQKVGFIRLVSAIIVRAIGDLHGNNGRLKNDAQAYFAGDAYLKHKAQLGVQEELIDRLVTEAGQVVVTTYYQDDNE